MGESKTNRFRLRNTSATPSPAATRSYPPKTRSATAAGVRSSMDFSRASRGASPSKEIVHRGPEVPSTRNVRIRISPCSIQLPTQSMWAAKAISAAGNGPSRMEPLHSSVAVIPTISEASERARNTHTRPSPLARSTTLPSIGRDRGGRPVRRMNRPALVNTTTPEPEAAAARILTVLTVLGDGPAVALAVAERASTAAQEYRRNTGHPQDVARTFTSEPNETP